MVKSPALRIIDTYCGLHNHILAFAQKLPESQIAWQPRARKLSIAFFLWHLGRWADHIQAAIPGMTVELGSRLGPGKQVWESQREMPHWSGVVGELGYAETGMDMDEEQAAALKFPPKNLLLDYVGNAFRAAEQAVRSVDEAQFMMEEQPQPLTEGIWSAGGTVGDAILEHVIHSSRHLGMIEYLVGLQVGAGTATQ